MIKILIVDDEQPICDLIDMNLSAAGYACVAVQDGLAAIEAVEKNTFDLILLDIMLPEIDGYELMDYIRPLEIPVIFLTAKANTEDKVKGLKAGADDYLTKPFEIAELLARVETVLRRCQKTESRLKAGDLEIDMSARIVKKQGQPVNLTVKEYELLLLLIQNKNIALFRDFIYEKIWGSGYMGDSRTVDLHVQRLRKKIGWEQKIKTVYKVGYRLED